MKIIPVPKQYVKKKSGQYKIVCTICTEREEWTRHLIAFAEIFEMLHGIRLMHVPEGSIKLIYDETLPANAYRIKSDDKLWIYASSSEGLMYAISTAIQICDVEDGLLFLPYVDIEDCPDKEYRALMVDLSRQWHPFDKLLKFVNLCFIYKIRYLNLHFADNPLYTLPSKAFPKLCTEGKYYTEEQIIHLRKYANSLGVVIIPEIECPGHANALNNNYPAIFENRSVYEDGNFYSQSKTVVLNKIRKSLLCAGRKEAFEGVKTLISEVCELFPDSPYIHIGGDEANIALWNQCKDCRDYMKEHKIDDERGLYSDYIARIASFVLSLGKTPMVWEGFPESGAEKIPKETIVISWENYYQTTHQILNEGFRVINASFLPLYVVPGVVEKREPTNWTEKNIFEWNVYNWQHYVEYSAATERSITVSPTDQVMGAILCAWEMNYEQEINTVAKHLAAMSERSWNTRYLRTYDEYADAFNYVYDLVQRMLYLSNKEAE